MCARQLLKKARFQRLRLRLAASVSSSPVFVCLHLCESGHRPLEGKSFLLSAEDRQTAGLFLFYAQIHTIEEKKKKNMIPFDWFVHLLVPESKISALSPFSAPDHP